MTSTLRTGPDRLNAPAAESDDTDRLLRAASIALPSFPGAAGQLLHREILTHLRLRRRFAGCDGPEPRWSSDGGCGGGTVS
jgi:hypothetical protein